MLDTWIILLISVAYVGLLFAIAYYGDNQSTSATKRVSKPIIYSLSLAVYCTSWTFYGSVSRATQGWDFLSIYLGPILLFIVGWGLLYKIVLIAKQENITTIADFIASRYGKSRRLAILITTMATLGILPYIALQLKAVAQSFNIMVGQNHAFEGQYDTALVVAVFMAIFAILFGTRHIDASEHHEGMVLAVAFESLIKLIAFVAIGLYVIFIYFDGFGGLDRYLAESGMYEKMGAFNPLKISFLTETLLAMFAILCLPRQFQVSVVENTDPRDIHTARWMFPSYLLIFSLFMLPIAAAGNKMFSGTNVASDTYVLMVPLMDGATSLATLAYIGGLSAATGMVIVATISISTMISNDIIMPMLFRFSPLDPRRDKDIGSLLLKVRRVTIIGILMAAYGYYSLIGNNNSLVSLGLIAFVAVAQFAPALIGAVFWRHGNRYGALCGLSIGFAIWCYTLLVPSLTSVGIGIENLLQYGPFGISWLRPTALFGIQGLDPISHATLLSLTLNSFAYFWVSRSTEARLQDRIQADHFVDQRISGSVEGTPSDFDNARFVDLQTLCERFLGTNRTRDAFHTFARQSGQSLHPHAPISQELLNYTERMLAGVIGASSARIILASSLKGKEMQLGDVVSIVDEASELFKFNRSMLQSTIENVDQGISVVDKDMKLVCWNQRYIEMFQFPEGLISLGRPIADIIQHNAVQGDYGDSDSLDSMVAKRLEVLQQGRTHSHLRYRKDGRVLEVRGNAMPGGGYVNTYLDITEYKRTEKALKETNETLESRVNERTKELSVANHQLTSAKVVADQANQSKTRFLAAASHDLLQPLNAARLFSSAVSQKYPEGELAEILGHLDDSLGAAEELISTLIDISKLDAGNLQPELTHFHINDIFQKLSAELKVMCQEKGIEFHHVPSHHTVYSDQSHLRRIIQNFLTNAVRYTPKGKVLLGCRQHGNQLDIQVWDTGVGIPPQKMQEVFEEFKRLDHPATNETKGLGLGLAIADRTARMLNHQLKIDSWQGAGSVFSILVPLGDSNLVRKPKPENGASVRSKSSPLANLNVLVIDNEKPILVGMRKLLEGWGCRVVTAIDVSQALELMLADEFEPNVILIDYHLDLGATGVEALARVREVYNHSIPAACITADRTDSVIETIRQANAFVLHKPVKPAPLRAVLSQLQAKAKINVLEN
ncbi:MAG: hybrid sensor histidine kinase/response regulator [Gammaproteobacteria bacterium]|nr:hybrid sensor histidine kinase/response regulator [Gammaproteobacteria bacterium]